MAFATELFGAIISPTDAPIIAAKQVFIKPRAYLLRKSAKISSIASENSRKSTE